jgi:long-chain acyl-CoA synthetase
MSMGMACGPYAGAATRAPGNGVLGETLGAALLQAVHAFGEEPFIRLLSEDGSIRESSRRDFLDQALRVAAWCKRQGLAPGDRAILCLENQPAWGAAYFGIILAGGVAAPVDTQTTPAEAAHYLGKTRAQLVIASDPSLFAASLPEGGVLTEGLDEALAESPLSARDIHPARPGNLAVLIFTSGTTGKPKAVMLTHANLLSNVAAARATGLLLPSDNFLAVLPMHHAYPCMLNLLVPLLLGAKVTFVGTLRPEAILSALKSAGVSLLVLTPQYVGVFYRRIVKRFMDLPLGGGRLLLRLLTATAAMRPDPLGFLRRLIRRGVGPAFRYFVTGGARCEPEVIEGMAALGVEVVEGYGLSETSPIVSFNRPGLGRPGSVGTPLQGVEVRIGAPDAEGYGEILVKGPNVMPGYFEDPEATARAVSGGWFSTGDQGRLDEAGYIFVRGRERDVIVLPSGKKFSAEEVEAHYRKAPSVGDICVLQGEGGALRAVVTPNAAFFRTTDAPDVRANILWDLDVLSRDLPPYKRAGQVLVLPGELPKTRLGKVKRHLVEQMLAGEAPVAAPSGGEWEDLDEAGAKALEAVKSVSGVKAVSPSSHLELDLGMDSLKRLELLTLLEDALGRPVPEEPFQRAVTAREVVELAASLAGRAGGSGADRPVAGPSGADGPETAGSGQAEPGSGGPRSGGQNGSSPFAPLTPELSARVRLEFPAWNRIWMGGLGVLLRAITSLGFRLKVRGAENIPEGAAIICPNHASFLDGFMIRAATPWRHDERLYFLGLARFFELPLVRSAAAGARLITVDAGRISQTMRLSAHVLRNGGLLCVFPEGARSVTGRLGEFKKGVALLSKELGVPVVPAAILGTFEAWPVGGRLTFRPVEVRFGKPMMPGTPEEVRAAVAELLRSW